VDMMQVIFFQILHCWKYQIHEPRIIFLDLLEGE
jgi:hypothetical protein